MNGKWSCTQCGWSGSWPNYSGAVDVDGGYASCPNGCIGADGYPEGVVLNPGHPTNAKYMLALLKGVKAEEVRR